MAIMNYVSAIRLGMQEELARDENVFVLGEDVGVKGESIQRQKG